MADNKAIETRRHLLEASLLCLAIASDRAMSRKEKRLVVSVIEHIIIQLNDYIAGSISESEFVDAVTDLIHDYNIESNDGTRQ